jgi:hypothetical protein
MPALRRPRSEQGQRLQLDRGPVLRGVHHGPLVDLGRLEVSVGGAAMADTLRWTSIAEDEAGMPVTATKVLDLA